MDEWFDRLEALTLGTAARLSVISEEELLELVEERDRILDQIRSAELSEADKSKYRNQVDRIVQADRLILARMEQLRGQHEASMNRIHTAKRQNSAYDSDYTPGSVLFDKRK